MLVDEYLPTYDISDAVARVVHADRKTTWDALMEVDLIEVGRGRPVVGALGALRMLPDMVSHLLHGESLPETPARMRLRDTVSLPAENGGWIMLGEREADELALGLVGKFWRPVIEFAEVSAEGFRDFSEPGFAKHVYSLSVREVEEDSTLLRAEMRVATTDEHARRWFRRYWTFGVGSGAHVLIGGVVEMARDDAEASAQSAS